jgi:hypothetical protein
LYLHVVQKLTTENREQPVPGAHNNAAKRASAIRIDLFSSITIDPRHRSTMSLSAILVPFLVLYCAVGANGQRGLQQRQLEYIDFDCVTTKSTFESYVFVDLEVPSIPDQYQLDKLGRAFKEAYNELTASRYCDVLFREVQDTQVTFFEQNDGTTARLLVSVDGLCRGCSPTANLFSENSRRELVATERRLKRMMNSDSDLACRCPVDRVAFGVPSNREYAPALEQRILEYISRGYLKGVLSFKSVIEVEPLDCAPESFFEASLILTLGSESPASVVSGSGDVAALPQGVKEVYNDLQRGRCDSEFRAIDAADATLLDVRRLDAQGRELQFNIAAFLLAINIAVRGRCRGCPSRSALFSNDAGRRRLQGNQQSGLCFCAAGTQQSPTLSTAPTTDQFALGFTEWIQREREAGRLQYFVSTEEVVQIDPLAKSEYPSFQPSLSPSFRPTASPSTSPSVTPSIDPTFGPSYTPTFAPSNTPTSAPSKTPTSAPSKTPTSAPSKTPTSAPSVYPSQMPSDSPSSHPSSSPSVIPSRAPSVNPTSPPSGRPSYSPTVGPTDHPSVMPSSEPPSSAPSFSTLCDIFELDTQLSFQTFEDGTTDGWENAKLDSSERAFSTFLGRYQSGDPFPVRTINFDPTDVKRLFLSFYFYEIDTWDGNGPGGVDKLSMLIEGDTTDVIQFGWFKDTFSEPSTSGNSTKSLIHWSIISDPIESSPQGFLPGPDQRHEIVLNVPPDLYQVGGSLKLTIAWQLVGNKDEFVGLDNFKATACVDAAPSSVPSTAPSVVPTPAPTVTTSPSSSPTA